MILVHFAIKGSTAIFKSKGLFSASRCKENIEISLNSLNFYKTCLSPDRIKVLFEHLNLFVFTIMSPAQGRRKI